MRMLAGLPEAVWASSPAMRLSRSAIVFFSRSTCSVSDDIFLVFFCSGRVESGVVSQLSRWSNDAETARQEVVDSGAGGID